MNRKRPRYEWSLDSSTVGDGPVVLSRRASQQLQRLDNGSYQGDTRVELQVALTVRAFQTFALRP